MTSPAVEGVDRQIPSRQLPLMQIVSGRCRRREPEAVGPRVVDVQKPPDCGTLGGFLARLEEPADELGSEAVSGTTAMPWREN